MNAHKQATTQARLHETKRSRRLRVKGQRAAVYRVGRLDS